MEFPQLLDLYLAACTNSEDAVSHLSEVLSRFTGKAVLDCSVGTGFVTLDLIQRGHQIVCTDGSREMLAQFVVNAERMNLPVRPFQIEWPVLGQHFPSIFDLVICRGNSLVYADAWDQDVDDNPANQLASCLTGMYGSLKDGGLLYVDIPSTSGVERTLELTHPLRIVGGHRVSVEEKITAHQNIRRWTVEMLVDGRNYSFTRHSRRLTESELVHRLRDAGFVDIHPLRGGRLRDHYAVFVARKNHLRIMEDFLDSKSLGSSEAATIG